MKFAKHLKRLGVLFGNKHQPSAHEPVAKPSIDKLKFIGLDENNHPIYLNDSQMHAHMGRGLFIHGVTNTAGLDEIYNDDLAKAMSSNGQVKVVVRAGGGWEMSRLQDIDTKHPMTVSACLYTAVTDPFMVEIAEKRNNANILRSMEFIPVTEISLDRFEVEKLIEWIADKDDWRQKFEKDLQCISADMEGNPLLTTWIPIDEFLQMLDEGKYLPVMQRLKAEAQDWKAKGSVEVSFDAYRLFK